MNCWVQEHTGFPASGRCIDSSGSVELRLTRTATDAEDRVILPLETACLPRAIFARAAACAGRTMAIDIRRREFIAALGGTAVTWPFTAWAQQAKLPTIGLLGGASASA